MTGAVDTVTDEEDAAALRRKRIVQWSILAAAIVAAALLILALFMMTRGAPAVEPSPSVATVEITDMSGMTQAEAEAELERLGLTGTFEDEPSEDVEEGLVTRTDPPAGRFADEGSAIVVFLSAGPDVVTVPDVRGMTEDAARTALEDANLTVVATDTKDDPAFDAGFAVETDPPAGEEVASGTAVTLYLATGEVELPDLTGRSEAEARQALSDLGLIPSVTRQETSSDPEGTVLSQNPGPGSVERGSTVDLVVAEAPSTVSVPDVVGKSEGAASNDITGAGLQVGNVSTDTSAADPNLAGTVKSQNPRGGTEVTPGTIVDLVLWCDVRAVLVTPDPGDPATTTTEYECR